MLKQRVARRGDVRSGGYRTIILHRRGERAFFVYGFAKSDRDNVGRNEERAFRNAARHVLALSDRHIAGLVEKRQLSEVEGDDEDVPR